MVKCLIKAFHNFVARKGPGVTGLGGVEPPGVRFRSSLVRESLEDRVGLSKLELGSPVSRLIVDLVDLVILVVLAC